nr:caspase family protein [Kibdelosporangium sp. MJ126-NF4]CEL20761.1 Chaperone protein [Kibdelosporangium sp. MJ126-NF4]CTQ89674.1 Chaperone protein [Kibdelosporangium sp. MJ126-NF4]
MFKALLVGVPEYGDPRFPAMRFIETDLVELRDALHRTGYETTTLDQSATHSDGIKDAIEYFLDNAATGDNLLIYLSGHGVRHEGVDYLVPSSAMSTVSRFPTGNCVPINCDAHIDRSRAASVLVVVDACREGVVLQQKSISVVGWGEQRSAHARTRLVAYFYACSRGETAGFSKEPGFSILSRAMSETLLRDRPSTLADLRRLTQERMNALFGPHGVKAHTAQVLDETVDQSTFPICPGPTVPSDHAWILAAGGHKLWKADNDLMDQTVALVKDVAISPGTDPWHDHHGFALRLSEKVRWLLITVLDSTVRLSDADVALLVAFPFLHQAYWARLTDERWPSSSSEFSRFTAGYPRLVRRIAETANEDITRWLFHRWLITRPESYSADRLPELPGLAGEVFAPERVMQLFRVLRMDPALLADQNLLRPRRTVASSRDNEQDVHEQLIGFLLAAAYKFAIDPFDLPQVIVDHLGTHDPVVLGELTETLFAADWAPERRSRSLRAPCYHPAVHHALRLHADSVNSLLTQIERTGPEELAGMPQHANAEQLYAANGPDGRPLHITDGFRFHLDENRVQELLMGKQLYGDPALAVRELYQNALDACRYRDARTKYLRATNRPVLPWTGSIVFTQSSEGDRTYIECADNGIGMGMHELTNLFANAGARFTTLPEYLEEEAHWREHGIMLYPNSQFGIGVLSYFMLADELKVTTCRLDRDGNPGPTLEAYIAGPGTLSRVQVAPPLANAGTTIRLYLREDVSCTDVLRRLLWLSEFDVSATEAAAPPLRWRAGQLSPHAPIGADPFDPTATRSVQRVDATSQPDLWWCDSDGGILADGLWAGAKQFGAIINLTGSRVPALSVDRKTIVELDQPEVEGILTAGIPDLVGKDATVLTDRWLAQVVEDGRPQLADAIFDHLITIPDYPWHVGDTRTSLAKIGYFPPDSKLFTLPWQQGDSTYTGLPNVVATERLRAWVAAGHIPGLKATQPALRTRPSDYLLCQRQDTVVQRTSKMSRNGWLPHALAVPALHLVRAAALTGLSYHEVSTRLRKMGFRVAGVDTLPRDLSTDDAPMLSRTLGEALNRRIVGLTYQYPVHIGHVIATAARCSTSPHAAAERLAAFGYDVPGLAHLSTPVHPEDGHLVSQNLDRANPWLRIDHPVAPGHVLRAATDFGLDPVDITTRLAAFGYPVSHLPEFPATENADLALLSTRLDGMNPWLPVTAVVPPGHVIAAAVRYGTSPADVAQRLRLYGLDVHEPSKWPQDPTSADTHPLSVKLNGVWPWIDPRSTVSPAHVAQAATARQRQVQDVAAELRCLNYRVPEVAAQLSVDDTLLLSCDLNGKPPWLDLDEVIPEWHIINASATLDLPTATVVDRLTTFEMRCPRQEQLLDQYTQMDLKVISINLDGRAPWRERGTSLSRRNILALARETSHSPQWIARHAAALGLTAPTPESLPLVFDDDDRVLITTALDRSRSSGAQLVNTQPVSSAHVVAAAKELHRSVAAVVDRLRTLGYTIDDPDTLRSVNREDTILMSVQLDGQGPWLDAFRPVPATHLITIWLDRKDVGAAAKRLVQLGMKLPDGIEVADP